MRSLALLGLVAVTPSCLADWTPPADPDPTTILRTAQADAKAGRHEEALEKHVWYHNNALKHEPAQYGVRLSFALASWDELANAYSPAREAMRAARDAADSQIGTGTQGFHAFHDYESLNEHLGDEDQTLERFLALHKDSPAVAAKVYRLVEPQLVDAEHYAICGEYLKPDLSVESALSGHEIEITMLDRAGSESQKRLMRSSADNRLSENMARLIALLVLNDREDEAADIADLVRPKLTKKIHLKRIDAALEGTPPKSRW